MITSVALASGGGRRSAPASCKRVLAALMATVSSGQGSPRARMGQAWLQDLPTPGVAAARGFEWPFSSLARPRAPSWARQAGQARPRGAPRWPRPGRALRAQTRAPSPATPFRHQPSSAAGFRQLAHPQNVTLPLGDGDDAARIQKVENMARLDALVVGR